MRSLVTWERRKKMGLRAVHRGSWGGFCCGRGGREDKTSGFSTGHVHMKVRGGPSQEIKKFAADWGCFLQVT